MKLNVHSVVQGAAVVLVAASGALTGQWKLIALAALMGWALFCWKPLALPGAARGAETTPKSGASRDLDGLLLWLAVALLPTLAAWWSWSH